MIHFSYVSIDRAELLDFCRYAQVLTDYIAYESGLEVQVTFHNQKRAVAHSLKGWIHYGYESIAKCVVRGFCEYPSIRLAVTGGRNITGYEAVHYLVCHELAHHLAPNGGLDMHNDNFVATMKALLDKYPFDKMYEPAREVAKHVTIGGE